MVSVEFTLPPVLVTELGLNDPVAPVGSAVETLSGEVHELPLPLKFTVMAYAAELPGATGSRRLSSDCHRIGFRIGECVLRLSLRSHCSQVKADVQIVLVGQNWVFTIFPLASAPPSSVDAYQAAETRSKSAPQSRRVAIPNR